MIAMVCGDVCVWKPSEKVPLCGIACQQIIAKVFKENKVPEGVCNIITGGREQGEWLMQRQKNCLSFRNRLYKNGQSNKCIGWCKIGKMFAGTWRQQCHYNF